MFNCPACLRTCLRAVASDGSISSSSAILAGKSLARGRAARAQLWPHRRWATTEVAVTRDSSIRTDLEPTDRKEGAGKRITSLPYAALEKELRYLTDPLKLAKNTLDLLRQDEHVKALELTRLASRKMPCTVSWNHIIDYDMSKGRVSAAWKTYNEMKKRAQPPDAYTYTILLRGLARHTKFPQSLPRALAIYNSMYAENSPVRPSIIHTNAILNVCAHAQDLDAIFEIAAKLPSRGKSAPNMWTFTTIINAITNAARQESEKLRHYTPGNPEKTLEPVRRAVIKGRRMWVDIVGRWRNGEMQVDEMMVCAMGRLLLMGNTEEDSDDALSLVEQTMGIQRKIPRLGDPARKTHITQPRALGPTLEASSLEELSKPERVEDTDPTAEDILAVEPETQDRSASPSTSLQPFPASSDRSASSIVYPRDFDAIPFQPKDPPRALARPSNATLSLLVNACTLMHAPAAAQGYWGLLTSPPYDIMPDSENMHSYLRLLRLARASRLATTLVKDMATDRKEGGLGISVQPKTFRIAMSACVRDGKNPNAIGHAEILLRLMNQGLEEPDLKVTQMYVGVLEKMYTFTRGRQWQSILVALYTLEVPVKNLRSMLAYGSWRPRGADTQASQPTAFKDSDDSSALSATENDDVPTPLSRTVPALHHPSDRQDRSEAPARGLRAHAHTRLAVRQILQRMVALFDRVIYIAGEALTPRERLKANASRARLQAWITREMAKGGSEPASRREREGVSGRGRSGDGRPTKRDSSPRSDGGTAESRPRIRP